MKRSMQSGFFILVVISLFAVSELQAFVSSAKYLLPEEATAPIGLKQSWFSQATLDTKMDKMESISLFDKQIFVTTSCSSIQAFNGETGSIMWWRRVGDEKYHTYAPVANSRVVAVLNGTKLYIFDRYNGKKILEVPLYGQPAAGPQISERFVYIPLLSKKMFAVPLTPYVPERSNLARSLSDMNEVRKTVTFSDDVEARIKNLQKSGEQTQFLLKPVEDDEFSFCSSLGNSMVSPTLGTQALRDDFICWTTDLGWLMIGRNHTEQFGNILKILYKVSIVPETLYFDSKRYLHVDVAEQKGVKARPHFIPEDISYLNKRVPEEERKGGLILAGTEMGFVMAVNDQTGDIRWKFMTGAPVTEKIVSHENFCYIITNEEKLYCVNIVDGMEVWKTTDVVKVLSISEKVLYAMSSRGTLFSVDKKTGKKIAALALPRYHFKLINDESDRIYLATEDGFIQCLRETNRVVPFVRVKTTGEVAKILFDRIAEIKGLEKKQLPGDGRKIEVPPAPAEIKAPAAVAGEQKTDQKTAPVADDKPVADEKTPAADEKVPAADDKKPAADDKKPAPADDIFGEATGDKPKEEPKKKKDAPAKDPFSDIFD